MSIGSQLILFALQITCCLQDRIAGWNIDRPGLALPGLALQPVRAVAQSTLTTRAAKAGKQHRMVSRAPARQPASSFRPKSSRNSHFDGTLLYADEEVLDKVKSVMPKRPSHPPPSAHTMLDSSTWDPDLVSVKAAMLNHAFNPPPKAQMLLDSGALDPLAVGALVAYTSAPVYSYNEHFRNGNTSKFEQYSDFTSSLMRGLTALPPFRGTVYRGMPRRPKYVIGQVVTCDAFTSTSVDLSRTKYFAKGRTMEDRMAGYTTWQIQLRGDQARLIQDFSAEPDEREVLLLPGTKLKVTAIEQEFGGQRIMLEEVLPPEQDTQLLPNEQSFAGSIDMYTAAKNGLVATAEALKDSSDASVNLLDASGMAPLHYAAAYGHIQMIDFLVESKADVNAESNSRRTPLELACMYKKNSATEELLEHHAWFPTAQMLYGLQKK